MTAGEREPETPGPAWSYPAVPLPGIMPVLAEIRAAWIDFYDTHYGRIVRFVMHNGACLQDAQDAVQEAFTESWALMDSHPDQWLAVTSKQAWIRVVALRRYHRPPGPRIRPQVAEGIAGNLAHDLARGLIRGLASSLGDTLNNARISAVQLASDLVRNPDLDPGTARARVSGIKDILAVERDSVRDLDRALGSQQIDASGADLSAITIEDLDVLDGVIWTGQTTWPPSITDQVRACSREIRPGVYQVGQGNDPDRSALISV